jgi:23S rRNA-intervening sequence protein
MKTHKDLNVWQESIALVTLVYEKTNSFPKDELFGLTSRSGDHQFLYHQIYPRVLQENQIKNF